MNRAILEAVFGEPLMASLASHNSQQAVRNLLRSDSEDLGERKDAPDDGAVDLVGTDDSPGKLQVGDQVDKGVTYKSTTGTSRNPLSACSVGCGFVCVVCSMFSVVDSASRVLEGCDTMNNQGLLSKWSERRGVCDDEV